VRDDDIPFEPIAGDFGLKYATPAVGRSFTSFWTDRDGIRTEYMRAFTALAQRFAGNATVRGGDRQGEAGQGRRARARLPRADRRHRRAVVVRRPHGPVPAQLPPVPGRGPTVVVLPEPAYPDGACTTGRGVTERAGSEPTRLRLGRREGSAARLVARRPLPEALRGAPTVLLTPPEYDTGP
jgi:hypothetical protein